MIPPRANEALRTLCTLSLSVEVHIRCGGGGQDPCTVYALFEKVCKDALPLRWYFCEPVVHDASSCPYVLGISHKRHMKHGFGELEPLYMY
jgi:hypothetical protein